MMSTDREALAEFLSQLSDRFYGHEIVERLEGADPILKKEYEKVSGGVELTRFDLDFLV